jgi:hypothetical protein
MLNSLFIIDNVLDNPEEIVDFAKQQQFYELDTHPTEKNAYWSGLRTECMSNSDMYLFSDTVNKILDKVSIQSFGKRIKYSFEWNGSATFHILDKSQIFNKNWFHVDASAYAGVIYLNKNPQSNSGTIITHDGNEQIVDNVFNRLVLYRSDQRHAPQSGFGSYDDINSSRLTLNLFFRKIKIQAEYKI